MTHWKYDASSSEEYFNEPLGKFTPVNLCACVLNFYNLLSTGGGNENFCLNIRRRIRRLNVLSPEEG